MTLDSAGCIGAAALSDALDKFGIAGQVHGIKPLSPSFKLWGRAFTVRFTPTTGCGGTVGDFIDDLEPGTVVVLDNGGRTDVTIWGDLLTTTAARRDLAGTVIKGACRDVNRILDLSYPVFSRDSYMRTGKDRVRVSGTQEVVSLGTASVAPGDLLVGDGDGILVVPRGQENEILEVAREIDEVEQQIRAAVEAGASLRDVRRATGYHRLQRPQPETP